MTSILPPHESDVLAGLLQDLCSAALVSVQGRDCVLQPAEAVLDVVPPLPLQGIVVSSLVSASKVARSLILVLEESNI